MINRDNWQLTRTYQKYRAEVDLVSPKTVRLEETWLRYLLDWMDEQHFRNAPKIRPTFPDFVVSTRLDGKLGQLSPIYIKKTISTAKHFFEWLIKQRTEYTKYITQAWLDTLKPPRLESGVTEHEAVTLGEMLEIAKAPTTTLRDRRIQAAAVFWFLSGIRIGAFVTLPISAIDIENRTIHQWPSLGVQTKNKKRATTYMLEIPELLKVVQEWDDEVKRNLPESGFWFAPFSPDTGTFDATITEVGKHRHQRAGKDLKNWLDRVGLPYHSPHKFRHGHAVYSLKQSKDIADLKAVSQNLMHSNLSTTDGIYGVLSSADVGKRISGLGKKAETGAVNQAELLNQLTQITELLKNNVSGFGKD